MLKKITAAFCLLAILIASAGCRLAKEDAGGDAGSDHMIGVLVTTEYLNLFDFEGYMNDNLSSVMKGGEMTTVGDDQKYNGRIYATESEIPEGESVGPADYTFEGVDGLRYFIVSWSSTASTRPYHARIGDPGIGDGHTSINVTDDGESLALEGTIYVAPTPGGRTFYLNPVYKDSDGKVYVTSGSGVGSDSGIGDSFSQTMKSSTTVTENGKQKTDEMSVTISISVMWAPEKIVILQMNSDNEVTARDEYAPGAAPDGFTPNSGAAYIICEVHSTDANGNTLVTRALHNKCDDYIRSYHDRGDGILIPQDTKLNWQPT